MGGRGGREVEGAEIYLCLGRAKESRIKHFFHDEVIQQIFIDDLL